MKANEYSPVGFCRETRNGASLGVSRSWTKTLLTPFH